MKKTILAATTNPGKVKEIKELVDAFIELMMPFGILEMCRTGIVAIERGTNTMLNQE